MGCNQGTQFKRERSPWEFKAGRQLQDGEEEQWGWGEVDGGLPLMKTQEWQPSHEGHREESGLKGNADLEQCGHSLAAVCMVEGRRQEGETQWGLDLKQTLLEAADRPRRDPLNSALRKSRGQSISLAPRTGSSVLCQEQRSPASLPGKETLHKEIRLMY